VEYDPISGSDAGQGIPTGESGMKEIAEDLLVVSRVFGMSKACSLGVLLACIEETLSDHDKKTILVKFTLTAKGLADAGHDLSDGCRNN
jgi:hypothetical protein